MKKSKLLSLVLLAIPLSFGLTACGNEVRIGILQPVEHVALAKARDGFKAGVIAGGVKNASFFYKNAGGNSSDLILLSKILTDYCPLSLGIGTDAAKALNGAQVQAGYTKPLLFTAVTDPVGAGLVASQDNPTGYICGTTDANPVEAQIDLIKEALPDAKKIGILYTQSEINSEVQAKQAKAAAEKQGLEVEIQTVINSSDIKETANKLASVKDMAAIYIPTDNNIASNMNAVKTAADDHHVLVVVGEEGLLEQGGHITLSIDYYNLGYTTGLMAAEILLKDKKPTDFKITPVAASDCSYVYSSANLKSSQITLPQSMLDAHKWTDSSKGE